MPILVKCASIDASGLGAANEIHALMLNQDQLASGVEGNVVVANDCKVLVQTNVLHRRSEEEQKALCDNSCFTTLNKKYQKLLLNNCFETSTNKDDGASGRLQAAAYQIACQTTVGGKYCIPMLADLVANAGTGYDLCSDIVKDMGCCFQSYRQYMLFGTAAGVAALDSTQQTCTKDGVDGLGVACPCGVDNAYNKHASNGTTICSASHQLAPSALLLSAAIVASSLLFAASQ
ncbi:hypothetical protein PybrP1_002071 [[Pythium] brassicae (nom. inval.)]|nr:hypothetical protein PybrP1_002071 [[Pythium] brassicae (nom. inval.)]